jgi:hypothetical protein
LRRFDYAILDLPGLGCLTVNVFSRAEIIAPVSLEIMALQA